MIILSCAIDLLSFFKLVVPSLFSALVAFMLFAMTTRRDKNKDKKKKKLEDKNRIQYITKLAAMAKGACNHQFKAFNDYANKIIDKPAATHQVVICDTSTLDRLYRLAGEEQTFRAYVNRKLGGDSDKAIASYTELTVTVDHLYSVHRDIISNITSKHERNKELSNLYGDRASKLAQDIVAFRLKLKDVEHLSPEQQFNNQTIAIQNANAQSTTVEIHYSKFITPFLDLAYSFLSKSFREVDALYELIRSAEQIKKLYLDINNNSAVHADEVKSAAHNFKDAIDNLDEVIKILKLKNMEE